MGMVVQTRGSMSWFQRRHNLSKPCWACVAWVSRDEIVIAKTSVLAASTFTYNHSASFATPTSCPMINFEMVELLKPLEFQPYLCNWTTHMWIPQSKEGYWSMTCQKNCFTHACNSHICISQARACKASSFILPSLCSRLWILRLRLDEGGMTSSGWILHVVIALDHSNLIIQSLKHARWNNHP